MLPNSKRWSEKSNEFTRKTLANGESGLLGDVLHFKHIEGSFVQTPSHPTNLWDNKMSDERDFQPRLAKHYENWKKDFDRAALTCDDFSPPLLLNVPRRFAETKTPTVVFGQETFGWSWNGDLTKEYPNYTREYKFQDQNSLNDFLSRDDAIEALCWGYEQFDFGKRHPVNSPFWRAFRSLNTDENLLWSNVVKCDYQGGSILQLDHSNRDHFLDQQSRLIQGEMEILRPKAAIFFTGPYYDFVLQKLYPGVSFAPALGDDTKIARLSHAKLPSNSFRTYHPSYLSRSGNWKYVDSIKSLIER